MRAAVYKVQTWLTFFGRFANCDRKYGASSTSYTIFCSQICEMIQRPVVSYFSFSPAHLDSQNFPLCRHQNVGLAPCMAKNMPEPRQPFATSDVVFNWKPNWWNEVHLASQSRLQTHNCQSTAWPSERERLLDLQFVTIKVGSSSYPPGQQGSCCINPPLAEHFPNV